MYVIEEPHMIERFQQEQITQHVEFREAQLRIQLQTEELMITSLIENFQENTESERRAVISAQQCAISIQSETSKESSAGNSWKTDL